MEFETIKKDNRKKWVIGVIAILAIASVVFFVSTRANYKTTQRLNLINTKVTWNPTDLEIVSIKIKDGDSYRDVDAVPTSGYILSNESYCEVNGNRDTSIPMEYNDGKVSIGLGSKGTKCYLYFDVKASTISEILASLNKSTRTDFSSTLTENTTGTIYTAEDNDGTSYYYAGAVDNNWVQFGTENGNPLYWRIIRINGDGTIRMIYNGTTTSQTGTSTQIGTSVFNTNYNDNAYVGYMYKQNYNYEETIGEEAYYRTTYTTGYTYGDSYTFDSNTGMYTITQLHSNMSSPAKGYSCEIYPSSTTTCSQMYRITSVDMPSVWAIPYTASGTPRNSTSYTEAHSNVNSSEIKQMVDQWYNTNLNKTGIKEKISINTGFCGDRTSSTNSSIAPNGSGGYGTTTTYYGASYRVGANKTPSLKCTNTNDLYTVSNANKGNKALRYPVGLITADEVLYAGGRYGSSNSSYYLYTNQYYWAMSPYNFYGSNAKGFTLLDSGNLNIRNVTYTSGVRPVINLKADTTFTGSGTTSKPYVVAS